MRGPGTNEQQIEALREKIGDAGILSAEKIVGDYQPEVIALAYKLTRVGAAKNKLPKSVTKLLDKLPEEKREAVRETLVGASN